MHMNLTLNSTNQFTTQTKGLLMALVGSILMSFDPIFIKASGVEGVDAAFLFGLFSSISMFTLLHVTSKKGVVKELTSNSQPVWLSSVLILISASSMVISLKYTSVINVFVIFCASPIITAIFSKYILGESINRTTAVVIVFVLLGVTIVVSGSINSINLIGDLIALLSVTALSFNQTFLRKHKNISRIATIGAGGFLMTIVLFWFVTPSEYEASTWIIIAFMGLLSAPIGRVLSQVATRYITATEVGVILMLEAAFAPLLAYLFFNELPSYQSIVGGVIIFIAILYFVSQSTKQPKLEA